MKTQQSSDRGFIGYSVAIRYVDDGLTSTFPMAAIGGLAFELAEMLRGVYSDTDVQVVRFGCDNSERDKVKDDTERVKQLVIAARDSEEPGKAFLKRHFTDHQHTERAARSKTALSNLTERSS